MRLAKKGKQTSNGHWLMEVNRFKPPPAKLENNTVYELVLRSNRYTKLSKRSFSKPEN